MLQTVRSHHIGVGNGLPQVLQSLQKAVTYIVTSMQLSKTCIFCGAKPNGKHSSREHVLPMWLLELTGNPHRKVFLRDGMRPFSTYHFRACRACNSEAGEILESRAKTIVERILRDEPLSARDLDYLLDWFDKIRIGLWLAELTLDGNTFNIRPKFFVNDRMRLRDRLLVIYRGENFAPGLGTVGTHPLSNPLFSLMPGAFVLRINNTLFLNISAEFCLSRGFGFPYPIQHLRDAVNDRDGYVLARGTRSVAADFVNLPYLKEGTQIVQLAVPTSKAAGAEYYVDPYVNEFVDRDRPGMTVPLLVRASRVTPYPQAESLDWLPEISHPDVDQRLFGKIASDVATVQEYLFHHPLYD